MGLAGWVNARLGTWTCLHRSISLPATLGRLDRVVVLTKIASMNRGDFSYENSFPLKTNQQQEYVYY